MLGDPECLRYAALWAELAATAHTLQSRATFLELSKNWENPAIQVEDTFARLIGSDALAVKVPESLNEPKRLSSSPTWKR
jgi:hypothetical protein